MDEDLKDLARAFRKAAEALLEVGELDEARAYLKRADELAGIPLTNPAVGGNVHQMTDVQLRRRGRAIAAAKASTPLHKAAAADPRYGSLRQWASIRKFGRSSVAAYAKGTAPCPAEVDKAAREDFPQAFKRWNWPRGIVQ